MRHHRKKIRKGCEITLLTSNDKWTVKITNTKETSDLSHAVVKLDDSYDDYSNSIMLLYANSDASINKSVVITYYFHSINEEEYAFIENDEIFLFLNDVIFSYNLQTGIINKKKRLSISGTLYSAYKYKSDFIIYSEMEIMRIDTNLEVVWDFSGKDLFCSSAAEGFISDLEDNIINLQDFYGNTIQIDYNGKLIK